MQTMTMTREAAAAETDSQASPEKIALAEKILSMTAEELALFIYLAEKELGLRFD